MKSFKERVLEVVRNIPKGEVLTYGEVASRAGSPGAARAVGLRRWRQCAGSGRDRNARTAKSSHSP